MQKDSNDEGTISSVQVFYGYMQTPSVRPILEELREKKLIKIPEDPGKWLILVGAERYISQPRKWIDKTKLLIFRILAKLSKPLINYIGLGNDSQVTVEMINV